MTRDYIKQITATGMKGSSFSYELAPCTAIIGKNFQGKTRITAAVQLALLGYVPDPKIGKKPGEIHAALCGKGALAVEAVTAQGLSFSRVFSKKGAGATQEAKTPEGIDLSHVSLMNPREYFGLSDNKRIDYVFARVTPPEDYGIDRLLADLDQINEESDDVTVHDEEAVEAIKGWIHETFQNEGQNLNATLLTLADKDGPLKTKFTQWNAKATRTQHAVRELEELNGRKDEYSEETVAALQSQIATTRKSLSVLREKLGTLSERRNTAKRQETRRSEIEKRIAELQTDRSEEYNRLLAERDALAKDFVPVNNEKQEDIYKKRQEAERERIACAALEKTLTERVVRIEADAKELAELDVCAKCRAKFQARTEKDLAETKEAASKAHEKEVALRSTVDAFTEKLEALHNQTSENARLCEKIDALGKRLGDIVTLNATAAATVKQLQEELSQMPKMEEVNDTALDELEAEITREEGVIEDREQKLASAQSLATHKRTVENLVHDHQQASAFVRMIKAAEKKVKALQAEMIEKVFGKVCETANAIIGDVLPTPIAFKDGDVGRYDQNGHWVPQSGFSGTEDALTYVAIAAALSSESPLRVMILDEMGVMTPTVQGAVLKRLSAAVEYGVLDQVLVVIPRDSEVKIPGFKVITL